MRSRPVPEEGAVGNGEERDLYPLIGEVEAWARKGEVAACT